MAKFAFVLGILVLGILLFGCTEEDSKLFSDAIMKEAGKQIVNEMNPFKGDKNNNSKTPEAETPKGECRFDSDCNAVCEGNVFWKKGCDAQTNKCVKTFETDCSAEKTTVGEFSFAKLCSLGSKGCAEDAESISKKKSELVTQANTYSAAMQETTKLRQIASKNCISALSDVTNKLIIDTGVSFGSLPRQLIDVLGDNVKTLIDTIANHPSVVGPSMSSEEYISLNCNAVKAFDTEFAVLAKKRDLVIEKAKAFEGR